MPCLSCSASTILANYNDKTIALWRGGRFMMGRLLHDGVDAWQQSGRFTMGWSLDDEAVALQTGQMPNKQGDNFRNRVFALQKGQLLYEGLSLYVGLQLSLCLLWGGHCPMRRLPCEGPIALWRAGRFTKAGFFTNHPTLYEGRTLYERAVTVATLCRAVVFLRRTFTFSSLGHFSKVQFIFEGADTLLRCSSFRKA